MASRLHQDFFLRATLTALYKTFFTREFSGSPQRSISTSISITFDAAIRKEINGCEIGLNSFKFSHKWRAPGNRAGSFTADHPALESLSRLWHWLKMLTSSWPTDGCFNKKESTLVFYFISSFCGSISLQFQDVVESQKKFQACSSSCSSSLLHCPKRKNGAGANGISSWQKNSP